MKKLLAALCLLSATGLPAASKSHAATPEACSSKLGGSTGIWRLESARVCDVEILTLAAYADYGTTDLPGTGLIRDTQKDYSAALVWFPQAHWQVGIGGKWTQSNFDDKGQVTKRLSSSAKVLVKYSHALLDDALEIGVAAYAVLPAAAAGSEAGNETEILNFVPGAFTATPQLLVTWRPLGLETSLGVGYTFDNSARLLAARPTQEQVAGLHISTSNALLLQGGIQRQFGPSSWLTLTPFVELTDALNGHGTAASLGFGLKASSPAWRWLDAAVGADLGLGQGSAESSGPSPVPRWRGVVQLAFHLDREMPAQTRAWAQNNTGDKPAADSNAVPLRGIVINAQTRGEILGATVNIEGFPTVIATDRQHGTFQTWPLDPHTAVYSLTAHAPGYHPQTVRVDVQNQAGKGPVEIALTADNGDLAMAVRGFLRDKKTGVGIAGHVYFVRDELSIHASKGGAFKAIIKSGAQEIIITAPHYAEQKRRIQGEPGETLILNFELTRANRALQRSTGAP